MCYDFPPATRFGRTIPKTKFYEHAAIEGKLKRKFIDQIDKIVWSHKLAEETMNLPGTPEVPEIEVFDIYLKSDSLDDAVLRTIDKAIPKPILFYLHDTRGRTRLKTAYKRPAEGGGKGWVVESYFQSDWMDEAAPPQPLPTALDLQKLYAAIIEAMMPKDLATQSDEALQERVERLKKIEAKEREYARLKAKRDRERQFNKKVELNEKLHLLRKEIEILKLNS